MERVSVIFQMEKSLKDKLQEEAKNRGLSLSSYIRMILIEREK